VRVPAATGMAGTGAGTARQKGEHRNAQEHSPEDGAPEEAAA
jgi:hypothetical protein